MRNRVRMLRDEMARARKKIHETEKKAVEIEETKQRNDEEFIRKRVETEAKGAALKKLGGQRLELAKEIKEKRYQAFL